MIDELYRLPESMTTWNAETVRTINKIFEHLHKNAAMIEYATTAPTKLDNGTFCIFDDSSSTGLYYKTGKGTVASASVPSGVIVAWSGAVSDIPSGWVICDGNNGTPNLTGHFIIHADDDSGGTHDVGDTPTVTSAHTHTTPNHVHTVQHNTVGSRVYIETVGDQGATSPSNVFFISSGSATTGSTGSQTAYALAYIMKT